MILVCASQMFRVSRCGYSAAPQSHLYQPVVRDTARSVLKLDFATALKKMDFDTMACFITSACMPSKALG